MIYETINNLAELAISIVELRFPKEFYNRNNSRLIFELIELVGDELANKNMVLFINPMIDNLVNIKDLSGEIFYYK